MTSRKTRRLAFVVVLLVAAPSASHTAQEAPPRRRVPPTPVDHDLKGIRNIFRYGDEALVDPGPRPYPLLRDEDGEEGETVPPPRVRLVGLMERVDGLLAALVVDGEVVLLAEGGSTAGFTVVELSEEAVVLRTPDGERQTLLLPLKVLPAPPPGC